MVDLVGEPEDPIAGPAAVLGKLQPPATLGDDLGQAFAGILPVEEELRPVCDEIVDGGVTSCGVGKAAPDEKKRSCTSRRAAS